MAAEDVRAFAADPDGMTIFFAHETWFDHGAYPTDWSFAAEKLPAAAAEAAA